MDVLHQISTVRKTVGSLKGPIGLVPTMGSLHQGHLALIKQARRDNASVICTLFVNPTQFGSGEDYSLYPRDTEKDLSLLDSEQVDLVFCPSPEEMYPEGFDSWVNVGALTSRLEGESRPDHFRGVCTIVLKLLNIFQPDRAYFGQKDAQQAMVIERMARDLNIGTEIVRVPIVRDSDGLALSSRNTLLTIEERKAALILSHSLELAVKMYNNGQRHAEDIKQEIASLIANEPLAFCDYISVADPVTLDEMENADAPVLIALAVRIGKIRLIDNVTIP